MKTIALTQGQVALVDDDDYSWLSRWKWHAYYHRHTWYAKRADYSSGKQVTVRMHRAIMGNPPCEIDHKDGNGLNNQRSNLRVATNLENARNAGSFRGTSKYKGVHWCKRDKHWIASIRIEGKLKHLGCFDDETLAAESYQKAALHYFGDFART